MRRRVTIGLLIACLTAGCAGGTRTLPDIDSSTGIPAAILAQARPIGHGARFHPPARGPVLGRCLPGLGPRYGTHVEVFAANRVVLVAAGVGIRGPVRRYEGRIAGARCYGSAVTLEPTGVVLLRPSARVTLSDLFRSWGQPLTSRRLAGFPVPPGSAVRLYVNGRPQPGPVGSLVLTRHAEVVVEAGPFVPPHRAYTFPPGA